MKLISTLMFLLTLALVALLVGLHETIAAPPPGPGDRSALVEVLTRDEQAPFLEARKKLASAEQIRLEASRAREAASAERDAMQDAFEAAFLELSSLELAVQDQKSRKRRKDRRAERARKKALDALASSVTAAESQLKIVHGALAEAQSELDAAEAREREAREASEVLAAEIDTTRALVADLSDDQVHAFQRAVDDALRRGLPLDIGSNQLLEILEGGYDGRQIDLLTRAYAQAARFERLAVHLEERAESTGDEALLERAARARERGASEKSRLLGMILGEAAPESATAAVVPEDRASQL
jgi:chromosome segregation ATPase